jgi:hypothetical protein
MKRTLIALALGGCLVGLVGVVGVVPAAADNHFPGVAIETLTNGFDADAPTGPEIPVGETVVWTYLVTNAGAVPLIKDTISVVDDQGVFVTCELGGIDPLLPGETVSCSAEGVAELGQYSNTGTVSADSINGRSVGDSDPSHYLGIRLNEPPDCSAAAPSIASIWPPNHKFVAIDVLGVTDPDGDPITITIDSIRQDEPTDTVGDGSFAPDGIGVGSSTAEVRAERSGSEQVPGDGRVYHVGFSAEDGQGAACTGVVLVSVPHSQNGDAAVDGGALYDATT